ncbi:response regulator [Pseudooceanicola nanhaiensis]|uniref:response regulator n=1 Tax=Pseudooceanicola nanhaiensis TaxID=375761 RepID=UPI001CD69C80|nr:response regulator [Pseudooceanicola nanhaiensis]MCA0919645.1 response regulator [Pseudooceanicola nanhaiensis]
MTDPLTGAGDAADGPAAGTAPPLRVIVVDDSRIDRIVLRRMVEKALPGAEISECETLEAARNCLAATGADLVLADDLLPDGRGRAFLEELDPATPRLLVSGVSSHAPEGARFVGKEDLGSDLLTLSLSEARALAEARGRARPAGDALGEALREGLAQTLTRALRMLRSSRLTDAAVSEADRRERLIQIEALLLAARDALTPG